MAVEDDWTEKISAVDVPLPSLRFDRRRTEFASHSPLELLRLFLPPDQMEEFAAFTNAAAPEDWPKTSVNELYAFIGAHLLMGIHPLPRLELYWSPAYSPPLLTAHFSQHRFKELLRFFRVSAVDDATSDYNPMPHVRSLADKLNTRFAAHYTPSRHLVIDETMVAFKGRSKMKQYNPSKPHKWGYKIYCLANENYICRFEIYEGKAEESSDKGPVFDLVMRMINGYENAERILFANSWFASLPLLNALKEKGIRFCGSVHPNRRGLPKIPPESIAALKRGEWIQRQKGDISFVLWKDQKVVRVLSNHCSPMETSSLSRWGDSNEKVQIGCPRAVRDYFYHARSVDVVNQLHYAYLMGRKAMRCWPRLAWWLLDACILNAFHLDQCTHGRSDQLGFREGLMIALMEQHDSKRRMLQVAAPPAQSIALAKDHYPEHSATIADCVVCSHQPGHRVRARIICHLCKVHLCIGECFGKYHR